MVSQLTIEYDGTDFAGWARQPGLRTVQGALEEALHKILGVVDVEGEPLSLTVAGRTDRGVHAWGQVASYRHEALDPARWNLLLPEDVAVLSCEPAQQGFDARRDALSRTYCYRILNRRSRGVFTRSSALFWPRQLDCEALAACTAALVGDPRLHGIHADRDRPCPLHARRCFRRAGASMAICSSSGSRRTRSCGT